MATAGSVRFTVGNDRFALGGLLAYFGAAVLEPDLDARLGQVDFQRHLFAHKDVRVPGLLEQGLQNVQLLSGECGPLSPLFLGIH